MERNIALSSEINVENSHQISCSFWFHVSVDENSIVGNITDWFELYDTQT